MAQFIMIEGKWLVTDVGDAKTGSFCDIQKKDGTVSRVQLGEELCRAYRKPCFEFKNVVAARPVRTTYERLDDERHIEDKYQRFLGEWAQREADEVFEPSGPDGDWEHDFDFR
jgi:hypothetical protein